LLNQITASEQVWRYSALPKHDYGNSQFKWRRSSKISLIKGVTQKPLQMGREIVSRGCAGQRCEL